MRLIGRRFALATIATFSISAATLAGEPPDNADVDFSGLTIELIVPYNAGGGSSLHAQVVAMLIRDQLRGRPSIVTRNVGGAGSVRGLNRFAREAKPDGRMIAALGTASYFAYLFGSPLVEYPLDRLIPILSSPSGVIAYGRRDYGLTGDPVRDVLHLQAHAPMHAGDDPASGDLPVMYCYDLLQIHPRAVWGVSRGEARQAFLRNEAQVNHDSLPVWQSDVEPLFRSGELVPLFTLGFRDLSGRIGPDPNWPDVPSCPMLYELVNGKPLEGVEREIYDMLHALRMLVAKSIVLPPETPPAILRSYQQAIERALNRPELLSPAAQRELGGYPQLTGGAALEAHRTALAISPEARDYLLEWLERTWGGRPW